jgi:hypothetical protein
MLQEIRMVLHRLHGVVIIIFQSLTAALCVPLALDFLLVTSARFQVEMRRLRLEEHAYEGLQRRMSTEYLTESFSKILF